MGTNNFNFNNNFGNVAPLPGGARPPQENFPLARQTSIYSLTFDELQSKIGSSLGKDFGSMNMDELLMSVWSAEESQTAAGMSASNNNNCGVGGYLQKQGSLTLPRTLSHKTVDEVWKDMFKEANTVGNNTGVILPQRQQTLGEMTLEEFLVRAGVVREENNNGQLMGENTNLNGVLYEQFPQADKDTRSGFEFQVANQGLGLMTNQLLQPTANQFYSEPPNGQMNIDGVSLIPQRQQQQQRQQQAELFPKPTNLGYENSSRVTGRVVGTADLGMGGLGVGSMARATASPADHQISPDGKSNGTLSSVSPVPYVFSGGIRGRRPNAAVEKVIERRQRRMIKNRESAARSRARKQAYTMELEAEIAKLKEENQQLRKKQVELILMKKNQVQETKNPPRKAKKRCLARSSTGPW